MRNLIIFGFFIIALVAAQFAQAQSVDDIISKYITAMGGKDKMMSLTSVRMTGSFEVQGTQVDIVITRKHQAGSRMDISVMGTENYQLITPTKGWVFMPVQGQSAPEEMSEDQFKAGFNQIDLQSPFIDYKTKGHTLTLAGKETVDGTECYKVNVAFKNGNKTDFYFDAKTGMIYRSSTKITVNGEEMDAATTFSNYKQDANGYWFAYTTVSSRGETNYSKIESNIAVDDNLFKNN